MMRRGGVLCIVGMLACLVLAGHARADEDRRVSVEGRCAVAGFTDRQAQGLALRQARALAVEKAVGVRVEAATLVTEGRLAGDFIRTLSQGCIVEESATWLPVEQYQPDPSRPPVVAYRVRLDATVRIPQGRPLLGLSARLNQAIFRARTEPMTIHMETAAPSRAAVFNLMADDRVVMLYPDTDVPVLAVGRGIPLVLPPRDGGSLTLAPLPGDSRDTEAILVAVAPRDAPFAWADVFVPGEPLPLAVFFARYASLASQCEDVMLPYEVFEEKVPGNPGSPRRSGP
ncbi:MAG: hypothetical protein AB7E47_08280 [Desulfovibrionaceae bacterium]